ncbi:uncharacterized protein LOC121737446 [Aricia agestis]|uniref:uncharacterized protein LOC121737446 n=1 Tax=Aricia agestis TaxID=91739 RepID=UPI001C2041ED|nr:uncharacterized protein LOC121737446 [Aricia agestis]
MKQILLLAFVAFSHGAKLDKTYLPPATAQSAGGTGLETPKTAPGLVNGITGHLAANFRPERPQAVFERNAAILRYDNVNNGDNYAYRYETSNGITAEETGIATNGVVAQGGFSYLGDDGRQYTVRYTADENGFRPVGDHLPTPPPIPEAILRSLEKNARDEAAGIYDDGSYNENLYGEKRGYNRGYNYATSAANLQTIKNLEQANIQAQAINLLEQAKQAQAINNAVQANIQAQAINQWEQAKAQAVNHAAQAQAINHAAQANIQGQAINYAAQANIQAQAINHAAQANIQAQAINHAAQANIPAQAINHGAQTNIQVQAINHAAQANIQAQAINHAAQANIQAQAIHHLEQAKQAQAVKQVEQAKAQAINSLGQAKSTAGSKAYLPPKEH